MVHNMVLHAMSNVGASKPRFLPPFQSLSYHTLTCPLRQPQLRLLPTHLSATSPSGSHKAEDWLSIVCVAAGAYMLTRAQGAKDSAVGDCPAKFGSYLTVVGSKRGEPTAADSQLSASG